jgi:hypothetical protein
MTLHQLPELQQLVLCRGWYQNFSFVDLAASSVKAPYHASFDVNTASLHHSWLRRRINSPLSLPITDMLSLFEIAPKYGVNLQSHRIRSPSDMPTRIISDDTPMHFPISPNSASTCILDFQLGRHGKIQISFQPYAISCELRRCSLFIWRSMHLLANAIKICLVLIEVCCAGICSKPLA